MDGDTQQDGQSEGAEGREQNKPAGDAVRSIPCCQVWGCQADMLSEKRYCQKKKVCSEHMQADDVYKTGDSVPWRFCFQCGKLEVLTAFDGAQRSCRARLQLRRKPKRSGSANSAGPWRELAGTARKAKRSRHTASHSQHSSSQQQHGQVGQAAQHVDEQQTAPTPVCCDAGGFGCTADSCPGDTAPAAAVSDAAVACRGPPKAASRSPDAHAPSMGRSSTAASANAVPALLFEQQGSAGLTLQLRSASAPEALASPTALHMASLQQKCQVLQRQLQQQTYSMRAASSSRGVAAILQPAVLVPDAAPVLQPLPAWDSPTSPDSATTAITGAGHMEMVEMVVAQLDNADASAEAAELEAMLEHELAAAANLPPEAARNTWASQINEEINNWSSAISAAALPSLSAAAGPASSSFKAAPAAAGGLLPQQQQQQQLDRAGQGLGLAAASAGDGMPFDVWLSSLQQQLAEVQGMVQNLRTEFIG